MATWASRTIVSYPWGVHIKYHELCQNLLTCVQCHLLTKSIPLYKEIYLCTGSFAHKESFLYTIYFPEPKYQLVYVVICSVAEGGVGDSEDKIDRAAWWIYYYLSRVWEWWREEKKEKETSQSWWEEIEKGKQLLQIQILKRKRKID